MCVTFNCAHPRRTGRLTLNRLDSRNVTHVHADLFPNLAFPCSRSRISPARLDADSGLKRFIKDRQAKHQWDDADEADFIKGASAGLSRRCERAKVLLYAAPKRMSPDPWRRCAALESELDKVVKFQENKVSPHLRRASGPWEPSLTSARSHCSAQITELTDTISSYDREVRELIASAKAAKQRKRQADEDESDDEEANESRHPEAREEGDDDDDDSMSDTSDDDEFEDRFVDLEEDLANVIADVHDLGASACRVQHL